MTAFASQKMPLRSCGAAMRAPEVNSLFYLGKNGLAADFEPKCGLFTAAQLGTD